MEVDLSRQNGDAVLHVVDHGIGIDQEHQKRLFQRFERAEAARDFSGFGLGLWISREFVLASGGKLEVESTPGHGATFTVRLPIERDESPSEVRNAGE